MDFTFKVLEKTRGIFQKIIENNSLDDLNKIPKGFNNNIIWNIAHVIVTERVLVYKLSGLDADLSETFVNQYKKDSKPTRALSKKEVDEIAALLLPTVESTKENYYNDVFENYNPYTVSTTGNTLNNIDEALEFVAIHEGLHYGYVLALLRAIKG